MMSVSVLNTEDRTANAPFYFNGRRQTIKNISKLCAASRINNWLTSLQQVVAESF